MEPAAVKDIAHEEHTYDEAFEMSEAVQPVNARANIKVTQAGYDDVQLPKSTGFKRNDTRWLKGVTIVLAAVIVVLIAVIIFLGIREGTALRGGWSDWSAWGSCSATCGTGLQRRTRTCSNPSPDLYGRPCVGDFSDYQHCAITSCYVCPDGWLRHGSSCYFFSNTTGDITLGQRQCSMWRGHLVEIENDAENSFLKEQISNSNEFYYYIGLNDINKESSFTWFGTNRDLSQTGFSHWFQGEPNNAEDKEDCVVIRRGDGYWNDYICDGPIPYICEMKYLI